MAKVLYGGVGLQGLSGSINKQAGGHTFTKNNVVRRRVVPNNPQTALQSIVRNCFNFLTSEWSNLTNSQREAWEAARNDAYYYMPDPLTGVSRKANSAKALFIQVNFNLLQASDSLASPSVVTTDPAPGEPLDVLGVTSVIADASADTVTVTYTGTTVNEVLYLRSTPAVSAGTMRLKSVASKMRDSETVLGSSPAAAGHPANLNGTAGQKVYWQVWAIQNVSGKKRLVQSGDSIIQA